MAEVQTTYDSLMRVIATDLDPEAATISDGEVTLGSVDTELRAARLASDALGNPTGPDVLAMLMRWNAQASVLERVPVPLQDVEVLATAERTATTTSATITNRGHQGMIVVLDVDTASGTGGLTVVIRALEPSVEGHAVPLFIATTAVTATGRYCYEIGPGSVATPPGTVLVERHQAHLTRRLQVQVLHGDASTYSYNVQRLMF